MFHELKNKHADMLIKPINQDMNPQPYAPKTQGLPLNHHHHHHICTYV